MAVGWAERIWGEAASDECLLYGASQKAQIEEHAVGEQHTAFWLQAVRKPLL